MKKYVLALIILGMAFSVYASTDPNATDNLGLWKPDADNRTAALADANNNWEILDGVLSGDDTIAWSPYFLYTNVTAGLAGADNWGLKVKATTTANSATGYVFRGLNVEARTGSNGEATTIVGGGITGATQLGSAEPAAANLYGLQVEAKANQGVTTLMIPLDVSCFRQAATEPTTEIGIRLRQRNTSGTGIDSGISIESSGTGETDDYGYGIDMNSADIDTGDIRLSNGVILSNCYDAYRGEAQTESFVLYVPDVDALASSGDHTDTAFKTRINNVTDQPAGYVLRGLDIEAMVSSNGEASNVHGANITAYTKSGAAEPAAANMYGLKVEAKANQGVTASMIGQIIRMYRQAAYHPTVEVGLDIQCANTTGTGIDAGLRIESTGSGETDDFIVGIDLDSADIDQAEIVLSSGVKVFTGAQATGDNVYGEVGTYDAAGSIYLGTGGDMFLQVADNGAAADWERVQTNDDD